MFLMKDFQTMTDDVLRAHAAERLDASGTVGTDRIIEATFYQSELSLRAIDRLQRSSQRLERLTCVLIGATIALLVVALPPFVDFVLRLRTN